MPVVQQALLMQPYLFLNGRCEEAILFYRDQLRAEVVSQMRFSEAPQPCSTANTNAQANAEAHADANAEGHSAKIMHAVLRVGGSELLLSDGMGSGEAKFEGFSLALSAHSEDEVRRIFAALSQGGQVRVPLAPTFWAPLFGIVCDRFGVSWMVMVASA